MATIHLIILRHAEAADGSLYAEDSQRPLTQRGHREAQLMGRLRRMMAIPNPDVVFTSGYERAEQTLEHVLEGVSLRMIRDIQFSPEGSERKAWDMILSEARQQGASADGLKVIWVVGHNPNIERLLGVISVDIAKVVRPVRKSSLTWLKIRDVETRNPVAELISYLPRPNFDERAKNSVQDF